MGPFPALEQALKHSGVVRRKGHGHAGAVIKLSSN